MAEGINTLLFHYCLDEHITFTRSRSYKGNNHVVTSYQYIMAINDISLQTKAHFIDLYASLNPLALHNAIDRKVDND